MHHRSMGCAAHSLQRVSVSRTIDFKHQLHDERGMRREGEGRAVACVGRGAGLAADGDDCSRARTEGAALWTVAGTLTPLDHTCPGWHPTWSLSCRISAPSLHTLTWSAHTWTSSQRRSSSSWCAAPPPPSPRCSIPPPKHAHGDSIPQASVGAVATPFPTSIC